MTTNSRRFRGETYTVVVNKRKNKFYGQVPYGVAEGANMEEMMDGVYELIQPFEDYPFDVVFDTSNIKGEVF